MYYKILKNNNVNDIINNLPYDLKILIYKIFIVNNPYFIFDLYFNKQKLTKKIDITYKNFSEGIYKKQEEIYVLNKLILQYKLFNLKFKDIPIYYDDKFNQKDKFLYNLNDFIGNLDESLKKIYNSYEKREKYFWGYIPYTYKKIISLDMVDEDLINMGSDFNGSIALLIDRMDFNISTYLEQITQKKDFIPFNIVYKL